MICMLSRILAAQCAAAILKSMCGRVTLLSRGEIRGIAQRLTVRVRQTKLPLWDDCVRPGGLLPALVADKQPCDAGAEMTLRLDMFSWGYALAGSSKLVYNARIENSENPMWASSFLERRAIVPVASFFEPHRTEKELDSKTGRMRKRSYIFESREDEPLLLAAIYLDDRISIVTTEPNESVAPIHPRMPLVLRVEDISTWIGDDWRDLADRSVVELAAEPENRDIEGFEQVSLF